MDKKTSIEILKIHRDRLAGCKTFEEYRDAHAGYVDMLIEKYQAEEARDNIVMKWVEVKPSDAETVVDD